jgi:hypothetical protein
MSTFDELSVSDLHKDAFGCRPSQSWWYGWTHATDAQKQFQWDSLVEAMVRSEDYRKEQEVRDIAKFEASVAVTIEAGAADRATALRWLFEAADCFGDWEHFEWQNGLPFRYLTKEM